MRADHKDLAGGAILTLLGAWMLLRAFDYDIGSARQMGPGYYPMAVAALLIALGLAIMALGLMRGGRIPRPDWRPLAAVVASVVVFGLLVRTAGLVPAVLGCAVTCASGHRGWSPRMTLLVGSILGVVSWLLFARLLGLSMPALTWPVTIR